MRYLRTILLLLLLIVCLFVGSFTLFIAQMIDQAAAMGQPTPQPLTLAQLIEHGPGNNAHVKLSEFRFVGEPILEREGEEVQCAWLRLEPTTHVSANARPVFLRVGDEPDQAKLDEVRKQTTLTAMVASSAPNVTFTYNRSAGEALRKSHPELAPGKATVLRVIDGVDLFGVCIMSEESHYEHSNATTARILGWGLLGVSMFAGLLLLRGLASCVVPGPKPAGPPNEDELRARLLSEQPYSVHNFLLGGAFVESLLWGIFSFVCLIGSLFSLAMSGSFVRTRPILCVLAVIFALLLFAGIFVCIARAILIFGGGTVKIGIFPSGLRWTTLVGNRAALWSDIATVHRSAAVSRNGMRTDTLDIRLYSGHWLVFTYRTLSDYDKFADDLAFHRGMPGGGPTASRSVTRSSLPPSKRQVDDRDWR